MPEIPLGNVVGPHFMPSVSADGDLSWTNNGDLPNPATVNIKGPKGDTGTVSQEDLQRISTLESGKVDKEAGKGLSTNDYTDADKAKVAAALTQHQDISGKVDKVSGKGLSTNDYTDADKAKVAAALTQHQDISGKVDKVSGKGLSTNDYTDAEKTKLSGIAAQANKTIIDTTLSNAGQAADAKATGDAIAFLREYLKSMEIYRTASGNPAVFTDGYAANVKALSVTITPTQSGSGDPSPDNVRPITGMSSVSVTRTGENGANPQTVTVQLTDGSDPLTVYGGTLDVTTGKVTVTYTSQVITSKIGTQSMVIAQNTFVYRLPINSAVRDVAGRALTCTHYVVAPTIIKWTNISNNWCQIADYFFGMRDNRFSTLAEINAWLDTQEEAGTPVTICYPIAAPVTYQLAPQQLATLSGYNAVSTDAGTVSVTYKADTNIIFGGG